MAHVIDPVTAPHDAKLAVHFSKSTDPRRYWWALLPAACGSLVSTLFCHMARDHDVWLSWNRWLRFGLWPVFSDLSLTLQHLRDADAGLDPLGDPSEDFAYPRAVLALRHLGLQHIPSEWLGLLQGLAFVLAVIVVLRPFSAARAAGTSLIFVMPAMLLGFERGNVDFALFVVCAASGVLWSRSTTLRRFIPAVVALTGGAILKLYPAFALLAGAIVDTGRRRLLWLLGGSAVAIYCFLVRADFPMLAAKIPVMTKGSWGALVSFAGWEHYLHEAHPASWAATIDWELVGLGAYAVVAVGAIALGRRLATHFATLEHSSHEWCHYWLGAGICCGCFAAANFVYRWAFALLTLPLLLRAVRSRDPHMAAWARLTIGALLVSLGAKFSLPTIPFIVVQLANWVFILGLVVGCAALQATVLAAQTAPDTSDEPEEFTVSSTPVKNAAG